MNKPTLKFSRKNKLSIREFIKRVSYVVEQSGWTLEMVNGKVDPQYRAPFSDYLGVDIPRKTFYLFKKNKLFAGLIHEMAHVFATESNIGNCDESKFLGWEVAMAAFLGCEKNWEDSMHDYSTDGYREYSDLTLTEKNEYIREAYAYCVVKKTVSRDATPKNIHTNKSFKRYWK